MDFLFVLGVVAVLVVIAAALGLAVFIRAKRDFELSQRQDETLRAGTTATADSSEAGQRATGTTAWMRPSGGGGL
jgi:uncharacterized protein HemX